MPTPTDTYKTETLPLLSTLDSREGTAAYDDLSVNAITEVIKMGEDTQISIIKRDGTEEIIATTGSGVVRGIFFWHQQNKLFVAIGDDIYIYQAPAFTLAATLTSAFTLATTEVGFCSYLYADGTQVVMCTDGTTLNKITTANAIAASATVAATVGTHVPHPVYYDGYLLLVKSQTGDCYNSDLDDPTTWTAGNFITAEINPDVVIDVSRINNYFILFGTESIEYFYNAGNPTGTPFARHDVFVKLTALVYDSVVNYGNQLFMVGRRNATTAEVFILEDFKMTDISTPAIRRWLLPLGNAIRGYILSMNGHDLYVLRGGGKCYYYDITTKLWGQLSYQGDAADFPITYSAIIGTSPGNASLFSIDTDNSIQRFDADIYQDDGVDFSVVFRTKRMSFGTYSNKFMSGMTVWADRSPSVGSIDVQYSDDDYATWSTAKTIDLDHEKPDASQWGRFRSRAFKFTYTSDNPLRIRTVEISYNEGVH